MTGHTPGPWRIDERRMKNGAIRFIYGTVNTEWQPRRGAWPLARIVGDPRSAETNEANAKLIAAAPALADALEALLAVEDDAEVIPAQCRAQAALRSAGRLP